MPEYLRALVVILGLATGVFVLARAPACAVAMEPQDFARRRNLWFAITLTAFLAQNFWIYIVVSTVLLLVAARRESNPLAMYFMLLFAVPPIASDITGLGVINYFFSIDYLRLLALTVLLPTYLSLRIQGDTVPFGRLLPDKLLLGYLGLNFLLEVQVDTFTNTLRHGAFYAFTDVFLPYYVASRSLKSLRSFRDALMAFVVAALLLSAIGAFEYARHWLLYKSLEQSLGTLWVYGSYLDRGTALRAQASTGQPIPLGYVIAVAIGFYLYFSRSVTNRASWFLGLLLLTAGLIVPLSRGPWVQAVAMLLVFVAVGQAPGRRLATLGLVAAIGIPVVLATPAGERLVNLLPFVGSGGEGTVTYRQHLLEIGIQVILQNPLFGAFDYMYSPAMQSLRQGQGIVDIVNTYLAIGLASGLVGLSLFVGLFVSVAAAIFSGLRALGNRGSELALLGETVLATLLAIMVVIASVSSITVIPAVYWCVAGLGVAYSRMVAAARALAATETLRHPRVPLSV